MHSGHVVANRFQLERLAGSGGMGAVWRALDRQSGQAVALKVIFNQGREHVVRFQREARLLAELEHPAVARYIDHGVTADGLYYLAMEWLEGEDLGARLSRGPLGIEHSLMLVGRVAEALAAVHARGIVHRDLKPTNVFLPGGDIDRAKLIDFGIARQADATYELTLTGSAIGTPAYMAPERVRGDLDVDARADLYSIGCLLFECITGRSPFVAQHPLSVLAKVLFEAAPRPSTFCPNIPPSLDLLVARLLAKNPAERPADAGEIAAELRMLSVVEGSMASGTGLPTPALTKSERRLVSVVLAAEMSAGKRGPPSARPQAMAGPARANDTMLSGHHATVVSGSKEALPVDLLAPAPPVRPRPAPPPTTPFHEVRQAAQSHGAVLEVLADGSVAAVVAGAGSPTDLAGNAARCALSIHALLPGAWVALATGWDVIAGTQAVGQVIDRAGALLDARVRHASDDPSSGRPVLIDQMTAALLGDRFETAAGGQGPTLLGAREPQDGGRKVLGKPTTCVGRERELRALEDLLDECAAEGVARVVLVTAGAGVGKSRLGYELIRRVEARSEPVEVWRAHGDPMHGGAPLGLIAQLVRRAAGLSEGEPLDPLEQRQQKLAARVARHVGEAARERVAEFLGELVGAPFPESPALRAARQDRAVMDEQTRRAWLDFLRAECEAQPVLIVLEDMHWGDRSTVEYIDAALRLLRHQPLLVLALARPGVREAFPDLWEEREATEMRLGELSRRACERIVREVLGDALPAAELGALVDRSAGNPFFLEELVRATVEKRPRGVPETVLAMMQSRLAALEPEARRVLRAAAVLGEVFWRGGVEALLGGGGQVPQLESWLLTLEKRELIVPRSESMLRGEPEFAFRHGLVRDAAYEMLTDADRALGHWLASEWLERVGGDEPAVLALVDQHVGRAAEEALALGNADGAAGHLARAARLRVRAGQFEGAIAAMTRAFELADVSRREPEQLGRWVEILSEAVSLARRAPSLAAASDRILSRVDAVSPLELRVRSRVELARALGATNQFRLSHDLLDAVFELALGHPDLLREALMVDLEVSCLQGQFARARRAALDLDALGPIDDPRALLSVALARATSGDRPGAMEALARSEAASTPGDRAAEAVRAKLLVMIELYTGDFRAAVRACERALELDRALGLRFDGVVNLHNLAYACVRLGDHERARSLFAESLEQADEAGYDRVAASNRMYIAYLDGVKGAGDARERLQALIARAEEQGYWHDVLQGRWAAAMLLKNARNDALARREFEDLLELSVRLGDPLLEKDARAWLDRAER
ncbi:protein kinase domain-containing protein [Sorangium sp. So ce1153]|uniref:protein kinase domain-containing protein n=1 Tax=Sorangium sp. So ce1153 TaxID=3133333 RepID=UPI003F61B27E